jgi:hypothetical protein
MNQKRTKEFSTKSMVDDFGRIFFFEGRVFRQIGESQRENCLALLNSDLYKELYEKKLIAKTTVSDEFEHEGQLVLEHERIVESVQHEWSFSMLRDAAISTFEINEIANKHGYHLKDAHTLNVLFNTTTPTFVDFGSISKRTEGPDWIAYDEFLKSFVLPLLFWSENKHYLVRKLLESNFHKMYTIPHQSIEESGLLDLLDITDKSYTFSFRGVSLLKTSKRLLPIRFINSISNFLKRDVMKNRFELFRYEKTSPTLMKMFPLSGIKKLLVNLPAPETTSMWKGYHNKFYNENGSITYSDRFKRILDIVRDMENVETIIDLAGNEGYFSMLLSKELEAKKIILTDYDENAIDTAYTNLRKLKIDNITPLLLNFMFTPDLAGTSRRLRSDLVVALAVTHHLVLTGKFSLSAIFERLRMFSNRYVIVEFMPRGLWGVGATEYPVLPEWYTVEWFRTEFESHFNKTIEEKLEDNRIIFVGDIKP